MGFSYRIPRKNIRLDGLIPPVTNSFSLCIANIITKNYPCHVIVRSFSISPYFISPVFLGTSVNTHFSQSALYISVVLAYVHKLSVPGLNVHAWLHLTDVGAFFYETKLSFLRTVTLLGGQGQYRGTRVAHLPTQSMRSS